MKKATMMMVLAAAAGMASCTAQGPKANLKSDVDTLSYMMGVSNTQGLMDYALGRLGVDSAHVADFIRGIEQGTKETDAKQKANDEYIDRLMAEYDGAVKDCAICRQAILEKKFWQH